MVLTMYQGSCNFAVMTAQEAYGDLATSLRAVYDKRESENIADWVIENITGKKGWERRGDKTPLTTDRLSLFDQYKAELLTNKPVQYVLNEAFFCGFKFVLNENVLIPRPETEELVQLITAENAGREMVSILDIGTGSGCIPISLKKKLRDATVTTIDVSSEAVKTAGENAERLNTTIEIRQTDFLNESEWDDLGQYDIVVSNPPYIPETELSLLNKNVVDYEPSEALFVPDNDPLIFYRKIERFCSTHLQNRGRIYLEVHERFAKDVLELFGEKRWSGTVVKDIYEKDRMVVVSGQPKSDEPEVGHAGTW